MGANSNLSSVKLDDQLVNHLNHLLELNIDSQTGYKLAAANVHEAQYRGMLEEYANQRSLFASHLSQLINRTNENPTDMGTLSGVLREGWLNLKAALGSGDGAILAECASEDETVIRAYQDALGKITQEPLLEMLRGQFTDIRNAYERVKALSGALSARRSEF